MKKSLRWLIIIWLGISYNKALAAQQITNLIIPISYFVNHEKQLKEIKEHLSQHRKVSIIGTSGIGKTQLARIYAQKNQDLYNIIWFFDCNLNLKEEFIKLAKQLNQFLKANISEEANSAQEEVINYLFHQKKWLLVFDNLKIGENKKIKEIIDWHHKGALIFCSQDSKGLPNVLEMNLLAEEDAIKLTKSLLATQNVQDSEFLIKAFSGYPILLVQGAQLLNKIKGLSREEYKKKIYQSADKIEVNINRAINELSPSAVSLLSKIALINNQGFSYEMLRAIIQNEDTIKEDISQLSKFLLISYIDTGPKNPIFEMHDIIADKVREINGNKNNKEYLEDIIVKLVNFIPDDIIKAYHFRNSKTIHDNFEIIVKNAQKYNINIYKLLLLNENLMTQYIDSFNNYKAEKLVNWFNKNKQEGKFKVWVMSNYEKAAYASYLELIGMYYRYICQWGKALEYYTEAKGVLSVIKGYEAFKYDIFHLLADINIRLGDLPQAEKNIQIMENMLNSGLVSGGDIISLYTVKACLLYTQGKYIEALEKLNQSIKTLFDMGTDSNDTVLSVRYLCKGAILNSIGRYREAYKQVEQAYKIYSNVKKENPAIFSRIYIQFARSELGQEKLPKALEHINKAIGILLADELRNPKNIAYSEDPELAASYVVQGEVLFAKNHLRKAIESYKKAHMIYSYLYGKNLKNVAQVSYLYLQGAKAACKLKNVYNYTIFRYQQLKEFGENHPNTIAMLKYCKQYKGVADHKN
ncbi:tetratricopeptide repeat protein [Candidatus Tisiphia endosymbiont of Beris chalybata]|uniref:tetratricopeptide repeat protein n=1 Tax=Candidatus Tisiphia endosymbiont of Beris chalybata TaxID=3066262 RepID=UPI00312C724E